MLRLILALLWINSLASSPSAYGAPSPSLTDDDENTEPENHPILESSTQEPHHHEEHTNHTNQNSSIPIRFSTSSSAQGYLVRTTGLRISTMTRDSLMIISITVGVFVDFETRVEGKKICVEINMGEGAKKYATIRVPEAVNVSDVTLERSGDRIVMTGPSNTRPGAGGVQTSSRRSSAASPSQATNSSSTAPSSSSPDPGANMASTFNSPSSSNSFPVATASDTASDKTMRNPKTNAAKILGQLD